MKKVPPQSFAVLRPTFGIGVLIGVFILAAGHFSGSDPAMGVVLGGGVGILVGVSQIARNRAAATVAASEEGGESRR